MRPNAAILRDPQQEAPRAHCARCGAEQYRYDTVYVQNSRTLCARCMEQTYAHESGFVSLLELSRGYCAQAEVLRTRLALLRAWRRESADEREKSRLEYRIRVLNAMWREARALAVLTGRYYERGYRRDVRYTV